MQADVIVIGGGIAGLACATEMCRSGLRTIVLESDQILGGRARSWNETTTGDTVDIGPHILLSQYQNMLHWLDDLGTGDQVVWQTDKFLTLVDRPRPVDIHMHNLPAPLHFLPSLLKLPQVSKRDLLSNRRLIWQVMRLNKVDINQLDAVNAEAHLRKMGVSERFIDWFWRSACMTIMNVPLQHCSAAALLSFFRFMMGKSGYKIGLAATGLGDLYVPAATRRIEEAGGRVLTGTQVAKITHTQNRVTGVILADGTAVQASTCVACVPPQQLRPLLPEQWVQAHQTFKNLNQFKPSPYISTYLWFDRKLTDQRSWARVWRPTNLNYDSYDLSNIRQDWRERPSVIASNIIYSHRATHMSDKQIIAATIAELADYLPNVTAAKLKHARVHRIPMAVPAAYPGIEQMRPENITPIDGLFLAGDWTRTELPFSMESATRSGFLAAEKVLEQAGQPRKIAKPLPEAESLVRLLGGP